MSTTITVSWNIDSYNSRRYSKPWGARIEFNETKPKYNFSFGQYLGDDTGGRIIISCNPGDIVAHGQKDNRKPKDSINRLYIVNADGSKMLTDQAGAYDHWQIHRGK
jgi:hypothetical protein